MSAVMSHMARDEGIVLKLALMVVPSVDIRWVIAEEPLKSKVAARYPSLALVENNPWGPKSRMDWFMDYWIPKEKSGTCADRNANECELTAIGVRESAASDWRASPILQTNFKDLPRTHIITAEYDLSRDESHTYGDLIKKHGNEVTMKCYPGMPHAFGHYNHPERGLTQSHQYIDDTCEVIRSAHGL